MLHQVVTAEPPLLGISADAPHLAQPSAVIALVASARRSLEDDPPLARHYLDQIVALFERPNEAAQIERALIPALPARSNQGTIKGGLASWQLRKVTEHIERELGQVVVIETLAKVTRLSIGHFCRAFKASMGETPHAFLVRQRIRRAQTLMLKSDDTLSQIACACGLTDQAHLTRLFRRIVGTTPMTWRRTWRQPA